jgi:hypothetical protein
MLRGSLKLRTLSDKHFAPIGLIKGRSQLSVDLCMSESACWGLVHKVLSKEWLQTSWCVLGVIGSLMLYGVLQVRRVCRSLWL